MKKIFGKIWRYIRAHSRVVGISLLSCFFAASAVIGTLYAVNSYFSDKEMNRRRELAAPYELERMRLYHELEHFDANIRAATLGGTTLTIMLKGADVEIYDNVWPIFREMNEAMNAPPEGEEPPQTEEPVEDLWHISATVCFTEDELPGMDGMLSAEQLGELLADGWSTAVFVTQNNADDLDSYLTAMEQRYAELGLEWTDTVCFEREVYDVAFDQNMEYNRFDETLIAHGITTAIDAVDEGEDILSRNLEHGIWHVKADGWSLAQSKGSAIANYTQLLEHRGAMTFIVEIWHGANREGPTHFIPHFSDAHFKSMMVRLCESVVVDRLSVSAASGGKARYQDFIDRYEDRLIYNEPNRQVLINRLTEVKAILRDIYTGNYKA